MDHPIQNNNRRYKTFFKKTKRGSVCKVSRVKYIRDDIYCGVQSCKICDTLKARISSNASTILVIDTNVALSQIDLLENAAIVGVVVLSVVMSEVLKRNKSVFTKLRQMCSSPETQITSYNRLDTCIEERKGESPNDRNDRAIRVATQWYQKHLGSAARVLLITNDRENRRKAGEEGIAAMIVELYVKSLGQQELLNLLKQSSSKVVETDDAKNLRPSKRQLIYREEA